MDKELIKNIIKKRISLRKTIPFKLYIDMDGVLTDFVGAFRNIGVGDLDDLSSKERWDAIDSQGIKWWSAMSWMPDGKALWNFVKKHKPSILSAPSNKIESAIGKHIWVRRELGKDVNLIIKKADQKHHYADSKSILVDDMADNINAWRAAGGVGILHKSASQTIKDLKKLGF